MILSIALAVLGLVAAIFVWAEVSYGERLARVNRMLGRVTPVAHAEEGRATIAGVVEADNVLATPEVGGVCVAFRVEVFEWAYDEIMYWKKIEDVADAVPFRVRDPSGRTTVLPDDELQLVDRDPVEICAWREDAEAGPQEGDQRVLVHRLCPGDPAVVCGRLAFAAGPSELSVFSGYRTTPKCVVLRPTPLDGMIAAVGRAESIEQHLRQHPPAFHRA
jgi:hypothetical protein